MNTIISLSGFMGCGKSTVGEILSGDLGLPFVDLDAYIEESEGISIPEIFRMSGEATFRAMEMEALTEILGEYGACVLSLGGGTLTTPFCLSFVKDYTFNVYLKTSPEVLARRLEKESSGRPMLSGEGTLEEKISRLLSSREEAYEGAASITVCTDGKTPEEVADEILENLPRSFISKIPGWGI